LTGESGDLVRADACALEPLLVDREGVGRLLGVSRATLNRMISKGTFPKGSRLPGTACIVWRVDVVRRWVAETIPARGRPKTPAAELPRECSAAD
jgi:predicted DNA-binding transcriptional regulator AlpA